MSAEQLTALWRQIDHTARPGARVIFRTAARESVLENKLPKALMRPWRYERALGDRLLAQDRSAIYGGFHVYSRIG
jgi:S-adenosylmethionine-diacylglycerol 3-amino-3-carboxypropyl transferase